ncbi:hypothetical protein MycrhN_4383 [Mycolicibacterium rhodesiae NBB3]|uniref:Uncharacterized protein n=1 Tax=Mycolicibacterium rhodesiae (strain NBB3) TaxID=710685 RepID=G8RLQ7_MYCRN|nr:hypothetical protein MycrhN_4383 [Mycolicibacterium rhodesiae NBB3]
MEPPELLTLDVGSEPTLELGLLVDVVDSAAEVVVSAAPFPSDVDALPVALLVPADVDDALLVPADVDDALLVPADVDDALLVPADVDDVGSAWAKPLPRLSAARPRKPAIALAAVSFLMVSRLFMVVAFRCLLLSNRESGQNLNESSMGCELARGCLVMGDVLASGEASSRRAFAIALVLQHRPPAELRAADS